MSEQVTVKLDAVERTDVQHVRLKPGDTARLVEAIRSRAALIRSWKYYSGAWGAFELERLADDIEAGRSVETGEFV